MTSEHESVYRALRTVQASLESSLDERSRPSWDAAGVMLSFALDSCHSDEPDLIEASLVLSHDLLEKTAHLAEGKAYALIAISILETALVCLTDPVNPAGEAKRLGRSLGTIILALRDHEGAPSNLRLEVACSLRAMYSAFAPSSS